MGDTPRILAIIPARGGSKGLPGKNIKPLCGKPLIVWTIELALECPLISRVVVSTDDEAIAGVAKKAGADIPFMRPSDLAGDESSSHDVLRHCVSNIKGFYDIVVLLQPTTPLRTQATLSRALEACIAASKPVVTVSKSSKPLEWMYYISDERMEFACESPNESRRPSRRQDCKDVFYIDGNVYCWPTSVLMSQPTLLDASTIPIVSSSSEAVDIDTISDFHYCEFLLKRKSDYED